MTLGKRAGIASTLVRGGRKSSEQVPVKQSIDDVKYFVLGKADGVRGKRLPLLVPMIFV